MKKITKLFILIVTCVMFFGIFASSKSFVNAAKKDVTSKPTVAEFKAADMCYSYYFYDNIDDEGHVTTHCDQWINIKDMPSDLYGLNKKIIRFTVQENGNYDVYTTGSLDTVGKLYYLPIGYSENYLANYMVKKTINGVELIDDYTLPNGSRTTNCVGTYYLTTSNVYYFVISSYANSTYSTYAKTVRTHVYRSSDKAAYHNEAIWTSSSTYAGKKYAVFYLTPEQTSELTRIYGQIILQYNFNSELTRALSAKHFSEMCSALGYIVDKCGYSKAAFVINHIGFAANIIEGFVDQQKSVFTKSYVEKIYKELTIAGEVKIQGAGNAMIFNATNGVRVVAAIDSNGKYEIVEIDSFRKGDMLEGYLELSGSWGYNKSPDPNTLTNVTIIESPYEIVQNDTSTSATTTTTSGGGPVNPNNRTNYMN